MRNADMPAMPLENTIHFYPGLTKREAFAMAAMQALLSNQTKYGSAEEYAIGALSYADALLAALEAQP